jgi:glycosyltransferase involved in cell wall biosynthesis
MRILIDIQALQSPANGARGIGRYARALVKALLRASPEDSFILLINGMIEGRNDWLAREVAQGLPNVSLRQWRAVASDGIMSAQERRVAEAIRAAVIADCAPDVVLLTSLFEGRADNTVVTVTDHPTAVVHYDLIPYLFPDIYLSDPDARAWYDSKIAELARVDRLLAISDCSAVDAREHLGVGGNRIVAVGGDADPEFLPQTVDDAVRTALATRFGLTRPFVMFTGGIDPRKNIAGLLAAFAALSPSVAAAHQIAIICRASEAEMAEMRAQAKAAGLADDAVVVTGHVSDADLVTLYNACAAFVYPSWYEGFGLPVLEAMRCGAAVIGANASSIPEVIGRPDALFDPHSAADMARLIEQVLTDDTFRAALRAWSTVQAAKFSWQDSARRAMAGLRGLAVKPVWPNYVPQHEKPRLAFVSPLPPERSGISFYSADLLPALAEHYAIDLIAAQKTTADIAGLPVRDVAWLRAHRDDYDRVVYQFGNSHFHGHMFDLIEEIPGVAVLHDFFLSGIAALLSLTDFTRLLGETHGYRAVLDRHDGQNGIQLTMAKWPANVRALQSAQGVIVHSQHSLDLAHSFYEAATVADWAVVPLVRTLAVVSPDKRVEARSELGLADDDILICSFGYVSNPKLPHRVIDGLAHSSHAANAKVRLVFVGESADLGTTLLAQASKAGLSGRVTVTGWVDQDDYDRYLRAADIGIQLRTESRGESSAAVLDCQNYGLPVIVNAHGTLADLPERSVMRVPDGFSDAQLAEAIDRLIDDPALRQTLGSAARTEITRSHAPAVCALAYRDAIESFHRRRAAPSRQMTAQIASLPADPQRDAQLAQALADSLPFGPRQRQMFVDIGALMQIDLNTGIQRVVRAIIDQWLRNPPAGWRIEPVYADLSINRFRYARRYTSGFLGVPCDWPFDAPIDYRAGDHFLGLDLLPKMVFDIDGAVAQMAAAGVQVSYVVYDLLPITLPQHFMEIDCKWFRIWLETAAGYDRLLCISQSVANDVRAFLTENPPASGRMPQIDWFHLGADLETASTKVPPKQHQSTDLPAIGSAPAFLMVGTMEPRKGHGFALDAFELLWAAGSNSILVIAGKQGWKVETLATRLRQHPEYGKRLIWLENVTDAQLQRLYTSCICLIAASEGEGFGLPLIEASRYNMPILARDIPVFREIAGGHATFFDGSAAQNLSAAVQDWLATYAEGSQIKSGKMPFLTWQECARTLFERLTTTAPQ